MFRYGRSIFCLPHWPEFSYFFDVCLHWVSVVRGLALLDTSPYDLCIMTLMTLKLTAVPLRCLEIFINLADLKFRNCRHNNFSGQHLHSHIFWAQLKIDFTSLGSDMTCYTYISQIKRKMCKSLCHIQSFKNTAGSKNCKVGKEKKEYLDWHVFNSMKTAV